MDIPVVHIQTGKDQVIDSRNILYIQSEGSQTLIHTTDQVYRPVVSLRDFAALLLPEGFDTLDKSNVTNVDKVKYYDKISKQAYFDKTGKGKYVKVSRRNQDKIRD
ncbi:LytTR family DNA-binding domain-containing protein [Paenibacillus wynnii]|uniref:HTH LytTR-type domain-containing protein n=1 Tax=Paenibacillus wynnii TaxID=268407 RepID=A0A098MDN7_9BACL|nr:LytTR family DNA-binding domain-containing protein [Paenibacillus wynnii]KGE20680.1 hypothetical protein PWYN_00330 [Paenibacillus wynnii]